MLSKTTRISRQKDFDYIFKNGKSFQGKFMVVKIAPNINDISRFAIIVSKKVSSKAVIRNFAKRRIKNIINSFFPRFSSKANIVVIVKTFSKDTPFSDLSYDLEEILIRAKILKKNV